ncbi:MAG: tRNA epoxyqueuosine(34) reductase QueG [Anaerolineales bacterium]
MAQEFDREQLRDLTEFAKTEARRLGFSLVGVTSPEPPPHLEVYEKWLEAGRHGEMVYLETDRARHRRANPREILPECASILVLAVNYLPQQPARGGVAAYAVGDDYHDVLVDRLKQLISSMEERLGREIMNRYYTDTGPLLERELAQRAGLGWIGKNTCLISPQHGSYFLLAELLLDLPLVPDEPITTDHCGECTLCIEACPTACILPDRTLDATRCISYLTIELKGAIPDELRPLTSDWVFGCDICQQVCPWNLRFAEPTTDLAFQARPFLQDPRPRDFLQLSPEGYRRELSMSPLKRAKHAGLLRNTALAAANLEDRSTVSDLVRLLSEEADPIPRTHAAWALGQLGEVEALRAALENEPDSGVVAEIRAAIEVAADRA